MKNIWGYVAAFLGGVSVMAIAALKWFAGDDYTTTVKKLKQKRVQGNAIMSPVVESSETGLKRADRRAINKAAREAKKLLKNGSKS